MKEKETKKWYQSKTILTSTVAILIVAYNAAAVQFSLPSIPEEVYAALAGLGIYSRVKATKSIG